MGQGHNRIFSNMDRTAHGEVEAIRDACKNLGNCSSLYPGNILL